MAKIEIYDSGNFGGIRSMAIWLSEYSSDKVGRIFLSPDIVTAGEVDFHTDKLIDDLNKARNRAKKIIEKK